MFAFPIRLKPLPIYLVALLVTVPPACAAPASDVATDLRHYVEALNSAQPAKKARAFVVGAKPNTKDWEKFWLQERALASRRSSSSPAGIEWVGAKDIVVQGAQAQATVRFYWFSLLRQETLKLKRAKAGAVWQIVSGQSSALAFAPIQPLQQAAFFLSQGVKAQPWARAKIEMRNLKNLALSLYMNAQNSDVLFSQKAVLAAQSAKRFKGSLRVGESRELYRFNSALEGKRLSQIARSDLTVLFYDGQSRRLKLRYNGKAIVAFTDGHIELLTPKEMAIKIWNP